MPDNVTPITQHTGNKYLRMIRSAIDPTQYVIVDVYSVIAAYCVLDAGCQHALKKILAAGLRGKGDAVQDLKEAIDALSRSVGLAPFWGEETQWSKMDDNRKQIPVSGPLEDLRRELQENLRGHPDQLRTLSGNADGT